MLTVEVAANIMVGPEKHRVQLKMLYRPIEIKVTTFQWVKGFAAEVYGFLGALAGLATLLATLIAFVPKLRGFLKEEFNLFRGLATPAQTVVPPDISEKGPLE
jgi:hypothetical protein